LTLLEKKAVKTDGKNTMNPNLPPNLITHTAEKCSGHYCCIHNESDHHMKKWPLNWRDDTGVMERICPHGVGHPDPDDAAHNIRMGREYLTIHGCDGCCRPKRRATPRKKVTKKRV